MMTRSAPVYLDYNATEPLRREAREAMIAALDAGGNPSSVHSVGRAARAVVESVRRKVAAAVGAPSDRITFVSGATEGNALVLGSGASTAGSGGGWTEILASATEHDTVAAWATGEVRVTSDGLIDLDALADAIGALRRPESAVVSVMAVNNETGVINPIGAVADICHAAGVRLHCDASQAVGRVCLAETVGQADFVTLSGHKFGAPPGIGVVIARAGLPSGGMMRGGGQEGGRRPGTENVPAIAGLGAALDAALASYEAGGEHGAESGGADFLAALRDRAGEAILAHAADAVIAGQRAPRVGNTLCLSMPGVSAATQVMAFDLAGVAVSAGSACSSGKVKTSRVLTAMGQSEEQAGQFIRVSLGWATTEADIDRFVEVWSAVFDRLARPGLTADRQDRRRCGTGAGA